MALAVSGWLEDTRVASSGELGATARDQTIFGSELEMPLGLRLNVEDSFCDPIEELSARFRAYCWYYR